MRIGVVTGLASEAACLSVLDAPVRPAVCCAGARPALAATLADALLDHGCEGLVSFGTAGGLDPQLSPGTVVLADAVIEPPDRQFAVDPGWRRRLAARLANHMSCVEQSILGSAAPLLDQEAKLAAYRMTGAVAVDMESQAVGASCAAHNRPFLAVRVVADPFDQSIPAWLTGCIAADGHADLTAVLRGLLHQPRDASRLIGLARSSRRALGVLRRVALLAGPLFQLDR